MGVHAVTLPTGEVQIGVEIEDVFVPFASHSAARIAQYVERGKNLAERAEAGDELARDQIGKPIGEPEGGTKPVSKMTSSELDEHAERIGVEDFPADGTVAEKRAAIQEHEATYGEEG